MRAKREFDEDRNRDPNKNEDGKKN